MEITSVEQMRKFTSDQLLAYPTEEKVARFITPKDIHKAAKEAGIDYESKEFMDKSKELTGQSHLDDMTIPELLKMKDYVDTEYYNNLANKKDALQQPGSSSLLQHPQEGVGEKGSERGGVEPSQQGEEPAAPQEKEPVGKTPTEEELVSRKLSEAEFDTMVKLTTNKGNVVEMRAGLAQKDMVIQKRRLDKFIKCLGKRL